MNIALNRIVQDKCIIAGFVAAVTFVIFFPSLQNDFVNWDDNDYVYENPFIHSLGSQLFKKAFGGFHAANWHPLTWISHALDYALWGLNPLGHHLTNNIIHALNSLMVALLVITLMEAYMKTEDNERLPHQLVNDRTVKATGATTGILFGLHPLHVESVAWVAERKDLLCAFFFLLTIIAYIRYVNEIAASDAVKPVYRRFTNKKYLAVVGWFILSLLSKPMAVSLPFVLLIVDWYTFKRIRSLRTFWTVFGEKLPFFLLTLFSSILTIAAQKEGGTLASMDILPLESRVIIASRSIIAYLVKIILPVNLVPFYPYPKSISFSSLEDVIPIVMVIAITAVCVAVVRKQKLWISVWSYYVITLVPVLGIIQVGAQSMADRYTYLPSLGPLVLIGFVAATGYEKVSALAKWRAISKGVCLLVAIALFVSLSYATREQIRIWKNSIVLWKYVISKEPGRVPVAYNDLGDAYSSKGQFDMAIEQFQTALRLRPDYVKARYNLGVAYSSTGLLDVAIEQYKIALRLKPDYVEVYYNLGNAYSSKGLFDAAIQQYRNALSLNPNLADVYYNLGNAYRAEGQFEMATQQYRSVLSLRPKFVEAYNNLGLAYLSKGEFEEAIQQFRSAVGMKPDYAEAYLNLGNAYSSLGQFDAAIQQYQAALRLKLNYAHAHNNLGNAYWSKGLVDEAIEQYKTAVQLEPNYMDAHYNLGLIYLKIGALNNARREFESVLSINPDHYGARQKLNSLINFQ